MASHVSAIVAPQRGAVVYRQELWYLHEVEQLDQLTPHLAPESCGYFDLLKYLLWRQPALLKYDSFRVSDRKLTWTRCDSDKDNSGPSVYILERQIVDLILEIWRTN
jgi:hypothetical protein